MKIYIMHLNNFSAEITFNSKNLYVNLMGIYSIRIMSGIFGVCILGSGIFLSELYLFNHKNINNIIFPRSMILPC